jgi:hypothetical protein
MGDNVPNIAITAETGHYQWTGQGLVTVLTPFFSRLARPGAYGRDSRSIAVRGCASASCMRTADGGRLH